MASSLNILPLSFSGSILKQGDLGDLACSSATPTCIVPWGLSSTSSESEDLYTASSGVALGCEDGSIYVFHAFRPSSAEPQRDRSGEDLPVSPKLRSRSRLAGKGYPSSRSASPASTHSGFLPFHVTQSRVMSSVSKEQVEAPKNYVDFEEEPEKLRDMLKGKSVREKSSLEAQPAGSETPATPDKPSTPNVASRRQSLFSPASSTKSLSYPPSPTVEVTPPIHIPLALKLRYHVLLPHSGRRHTVAALKMHEHNKYVVSLQESGHIDVLASLDGCCVTSAHADETRSALTWSTKGDAGVSALWVWRTLNITSCGESDILIACATRDLFSPGYQSETDPSTQDQTRVALFEVQLRYPVHSGRQRLEKIADLLVDGPIAGVRVCADEAGLLALQYISSKGHVMVKSLTLSDHLARSANSSEPDLAAALLSRPLAALKVLSKENVSRQSVVSTSRELILGRDVDVGEMRLEGSLLGVRLSPFHTGHRLLCWTASEIAIFDMHKDTVELTSKQVVSDVSDAQWIEQNGYAITFQDKLEVVYLEANDKKEDTASSVSQGCQYRADTRKSIPLPPLDAFYLSEDGDLLYSVVKNGRRRLKYVSLYSPNGLRPRSLWKAREVSDSAIYMTSLLPLTFEEIIIGYRDGSLGRSSFERLVIGGDASAKSDVAIAGHVQALHRVENRTTKEQFLVGGGDDGSVAIWKLPSLELHANWVIFTSPLQQVIQLGDEEVGRLKQCILCVAQDGTVGVIAIDSECQFLYLVPASVAPLIRVCLGDGHMLLEYADGRARLWDSNTKEFWRSMTSDKANEMMKDGGWSQWPIDGGSLGSDGRRDILTQLTQTAGPDSAASLVLDMEALLRSRALVPALVDSKSTFSATTRDGRSRARDLRIVLASLITPGLNAEVDNICYVKLKIPKDASVSVGIASRTFASSVLFDGNGTRAWCISPEASAARASAIIALLRLLSSQNESLALDAETVAAFYLASLPQVVGSSYQPPSLPFLARQWLDAKLSESWHAFRAVFDAGVTQLSDAVATSLVEQWQSLLPCAKEDTEKNSMSCAMALFICGFISVENYTLLPTSLLSEVSKSIAMYLHDGTSPYRALAIELCSRGFPVWQQYVDAVEMLRALFTLATTPKKDAITAHNTGQLSRTAILQIMSSNTPLFMTTLTIDILHPRSVQHQRATLQLVIFLVRKRPLVLYSNLPRLVEAVVKSLDPSSTASRDAVIDSATEILGHIVQTFPSVDFHMATQRLAVGTSEGAVVMYDLKTATRLYVLEGHKKRTTACSFSPDGRRLVTVSLEESVVIVWKVGSSLTNFFNPGAPPRQGHSGSEPFKTLNFNVGAESQMFWEATLDYVRFEWPADRSVKLRIKESTLTFST